MSFGVLPLAFFFFFFSSVAVREPATHTPSMSHRTHTTIAPSSPRDLNCEVQIWPWIFRPKSELFRCGV